MHKARELTPVDFDASITLLPDLARHTLDQQQSMKPLLTLLRDQDIPYIWGLPFHLQIQRDGKTHIVW